MAERATTVWIEERIWQQFRIAALSNGYTLKGAVAHALQQWTQRNPTRTYTTVEETTND